MRRQSSGLSAFSFDDRSFLVAALGAGMVHAAATARVRAMSPRERMGNNAFGPKPGVWSKEKAEGPKQLRVPKSSVSGEASRPAVNYGRRGEGKRYTAPAVGSVPREKTWT